MAIQIDITIQYNKMTKINKHITIEQSLCLKLSEIENASLLIEKLLTEYFINLRPTSDKITEKQSELKKKRKELLNLKKELLNLKKFNQLENEIIKTRKSKEEEEEEEQEIINKWFNSLDKIIRKKFLEQDSMGLSHKEFKRYLYEQMKGGKK